MKRRVTRRHPDHSPKKKWFSSLVPALAATAVLALVVLLAVRRGESPARQVAGGPRQMETASSPSSKRQPLVAKPSLGSPAGKVASPQPAYQPPVLVVAPPDPRCHALGKLQAALYRCGENLVQLKPGAAFPEDLKSTPWHDALTELRNRGLIENALATDKADITLSAAPNDPSFADQTSLNGGAAFDIGTLDAWSAGTGSPDVVVAIVDSGIDLGHPDLQDNLWTNTAEIPNNGLDDDGNGYIDDVHGYNFNAATADIRDDKGHGTHGAGVIGAVGNNGIGVAGINWSVKLMSLKITDSSGTASLAAAVEAINYAIAQGAKVINASWVMDLPAPDKVALLQSAVQNANAAGAVVVAAAGNGFSGGGKDIDASPLYPASLDLPGLITVASADPDLALSSFSNFGSNSVDLAAPGSGILSTALEGAYGSSSGTSVAATFVSGAAAFLLSQKPALAPADVKAALMGSVVTDARLSGKMASGGSLNLRNALLSLGVTLTSSDKDTKTDTVLASPSSASSADTGGGKSGGCALIPF